jgi:PAS domain S-box-containing protein
MAKPLRVLVVEDSASDTALVIRLLELAGYAAIHERVETAEDMSAALASGAWDVVLSDYMMPGFDAPHALDVLKRSQQDIPFIVVSGSIGEDVAVQMMKSGAHDYVLKDNPARLVAAVERELREAGLRREKRKADEALVALNLELSTANEEIRAANEELGARNEQISAANKELEQAYTDLETAAAELRESETRYRLLAETAQESITIVDLAGGIKYANRATREILGCTEEELLGAKISCFTTAEEGERWQALLRERLVKQRGKRILSTELVTKDGQHLPFEFTTADVVEDGKVTGVMNVGRDISDRLQAERTRQQTLQAQKLEAIGTLAGGIAHDFNNILFAIIANAELMQDSISDDSPNAECLEQILQASQRAKELVHQILAFSRRSDTKPLALNISLLTKEVVKLLRPVMPSSIEMRLDVSGNAALVLADPTEIHQLLMNLCTNASHAMAGGQGLLEIRLKDVFFDEETVVAYPKLKAGNYVELTVSDSGSGMPPQVRERIFEPFFTTKEQGQGTGMGLAVVHGIVTRLGGSITVYSEVGLGTTFHIYLPAITGDAPSFAAKNDTELPRGAGHILVVDDERAVTDAMARVLQGLGYKVTQCNASIHALELFYSDPEEYTLVITDMTMPKMNGTALARALLIQRPDLPIILCTGFSQGVSAETASAIGICSYLSKPISRQALAHTVARLLGFSSAL